MKKTGLIVLLAFFFSATTISVLAQDQVKAKNSKKEVKKENRKEIKKTVAFNVVCPVSGEETDAAITKEYKGQTYALCCKRCLAKFEKNPELYSQNLSKDGKKFTKH